MYKTLKKILLCIFLIIGVYIVYIVYFSYNFSGNVYRKSEKYILNISNKEVISKVDQFKELHKEFRLITTDEEGIRFYYQDNYSSRYYHVFFYFSDINLTIQCLLEPISQKESLFLLYSVSDGVNFGSWKDINSNSLSREENKIIKRKFEIEILDKLGKWRKAYFWE